MTTNMNKCKQMIIMLHELPGIGWRTIQKAVAKELWRMERSTVEADWLAAGFQRDQAKLAAERLNEGIYAAGTPYQRALQLGAAVITPFDADYPEYLRHIPQPPWVLYALGRLDLLFRPSIAVVGTRNPTAYGRHTATLLSEQLSALGITVVSGMARGIDSKAHEAALKGEGRTIAVLASAVDCCYPSENRSLYQQIEKHGLLLSETPPGAPLHPGMFPLRNRIIAGLSLGTLVIEAAKGSGSLITADQALDMSRDVYAVPGPISSPKSEGTNGLIQDGAKLVSNVEDIIEEYVWLKKVRDSGANAATVHPWKQVISAANMTPDERKVIELLQDRPLTINEIHQLTSIPFGHLSALLINLCIKRKIEQQTGSLYIAL